MTAFQAVALGLSSGWSNPLQDCRGIVWVSTGVIFVLVNFISLCLCSLVIGTEPTVTADPVLPNDALRAEKLVSVFWNYA